MIFTWTNEQQQLYKHVHEFAETELVDDVLARDHMAEFPHKLWQRCADYGVLGWAMPKEYGGQQYSVTTAAYLMEAIGYGCRDNGLTFALSAQMWGVQMTLLHFGNNEQINRYLNAMLSGQALAAFGMTESNSGSDAFNIAATAVIDGDDYVLNGEKLLVTLAPIASFAIVFAATKPDAGRWGISAFLVDADNSGYTAHANEQKMGLRTVPFGRITLRNCRVPKSALLGNEGSGASIFNYSQGWERSLVLAPQLGAMQYQLDQCIDFSKNRLRSNQPIGKYQAVSHRIADMKIRLETARLLLYQTAWQLQEGQHGIMEAAIAKTYLSEAFTESSLQAIAIHGGAGYTSDMQVERNLRDAIGGTIYGGTSDIQRNIIASLLGL